MVQQGFAGLEQFSGLSGRRAPMSEMSLEARPRRRREFRYDPNEVRGDEVYRDARRHTGLVRWLKIVLPALAGAGIVAFFVTIKIVTSDIADLFTLAGVAIDTKSLIMEKPHLSGFKGTEHSYEVVAERAIQDLANPKIVRLEKIEAEFGLTSEVTVSLDGITVSSTNGYEAKLETAMVDFGAGHLTSNGAIEIRSSDGVIKARALSISDRGKKILFDGGVTVTFIPPENSQFSVPTAPASESE
jgi:lipopolysaccharide export system protein LptC